KHLLTYWIIHSSLGYIEYILHVVCDFLRVYWLGKLIFFLWLIKSAPPSVESSEEPEITLDSIPEPTIPEPTIPEPTIPRKKATASNFKRTQVN
ncbi:unnamed protein product, partial [Rotaria socialis]